MPLTELIAEANSVFGFLVLLVSTISGFGYWLHRRIKAIATDVTTSVTVAMEANFNGMETRLTTLEKVVPEHARKVEAVEHRVSVFENRIQTIEDVLRHLPDKDDLHQISLGVSELRGEVGRLDERLKPIGAIADRLQDIQLNNGS